MTCILEIFFWFLPNNNAAFVSPELRTVPPYDAESFVTLSKTED